MQGAEQGQQYYDAKAYWEERARKYGSLCDGWKAIILSGGENYYYEYVDIVDKKATYNFIQVYKGMKVLDVGCGVGRWCVEFARRGAEVTGVDISGEMIRLASDNMRKEGLDGRLMVMSVDEMDFPDNSFDLVHCAGVLMHVTDPDKFRKSCLNIIRVVRPGGQILLQELAPRKRWKTELDGHMVGRTFKEYRDMFESEGAFLVKDAGVHLWARLDQAYEAIARRLVSILKNRAKGVGEPVETKELMEEKYPAPSKLFHLGRRTLLTLSKPVESFLAPLRPLGNLSNYKLMLFQKE